ncbi:MAG: thiamine pyrophosphate-binding protein, partial [Ectothiorhodospiraceae bacterium]
MSETVGDFIVRRLAEWGVERVYGYSGDGINGVMGALRRAEDRVRMIQPRHEELAAFMASGHAKYTGKPGVVITTSGPGAIHALNGLYDARKDHMPVVAVVGQQARISMGSDYQQEVDLASVFKDVADYVQTLMAPAQTRHVIDRAMRIARSERTVTCVIVP